MTPSPDLQFLIDLARGAGQVILKHFGHVERLTKTHATTTHEAVTIADRESQRFIVKGLRQRFPNDGIIGEESDSGESITFDVQNPNGRIWVIDPIDGTNNFVAGFGAFAVCIGLLEAGHPTAGVVHDVTRNQTYYASKGSGAYLEGAPIRAAARSLSEASVIMLTSNLVTPTGKPPGYATYWLSQTSWKVRMIGTAALEAAAVASGVAHAAVTINGKLWDVVAPAALVIEAGGSILDLHGNEIFPFTVAGYAGKKVPFVALAPGAKNEILKEIIQNP